MNTELKALITLIFDGLKVGQDVLLKKNFVSLLPDMFDLAKDAPSALNNVSSLLTEIKALAGTAQEADLIAFIETKFSVTTGSPKAVAILHAVLKLVQNGAQDILALQSAIKA